tara:strand:+ start:2736 stop:2972 length:237 start_codon:yes stop_codon:yes gene_type:complete
MSKIVITFSNDGKLFDVGNGNKIMIIEDVTSYKEELCDIVEDNKMSFEELKNLVESWGGKIDLLLLSELIKFYKKNNV